MTTLQGSFTSCGPGLDFRYQLLCNGPSCDILSTFPGLTCGTDPTTSDLSCNNGVTCPGPSNYTTTFDLSQTTALVTLNQLIVLPDFCENINVKSTGTTGGVSVNFVDTGPCGPGGNGTSSSSSSSIFPYTSTPPSSSSISSGPLSFYSNTTTPVTSTKETNIPSSSNSASSPVSPILTVTTEVVTEYTTYCPEATIFTEGSSTYTVTSPTTLTITNCPCTRTHLLTGDTPTPTTSTTSSIEFYSSSGFPGSEGFSKSGFGSTMTVPVPSSSNKPTIPVQASSASSLRSGFKLSPSRLITIFLGFFFLFGNTLASSNHLDSDSDAKLDLEDKDTAVVQNNYHAKLSTNAAMVDASYLDLVKQRQSEPGWKTFADLLGEYLGGKLNSPEFADNLIAEMEEAVCDHAVGVIITKSLGVDLVEACVTAIDVAGGLAALGTLQPEIEFLAVLESSILCNALVAAALPGIGEVTDTICKEKKPCSEDLRTDVNNCGQCGNTCPSGQSCINGACTSGTCTGQTCDTFGPCGPGGNCVCASTSESTGYCVDGSTPCDGLASCGTSLDCASGEICAVGSCCPGNVCVGATFCGGSAGGDVTARGMLKRAWVNSTISSKGDWTPFFF